MQPRLLAILDLLSSILYLRFSVTFACSPPSPAPEHLSVGHSTGQRERRTTCSAVLPNRKVDNRRVVVAHHDQIACHSSRQRQSDPPVSPRGAVPQPEIRWQFLRRSRKSTRHPAGILQRFRRRGQHLRAKRDRRLNHVQQRHLGPSSVASSAPVLAARPEDSLSSTRSESAEKFL